MVCTLRGSKTDQEGAGREVRIPYAKDKNICSVRALKMWLKQAKIKTAPVFRRVDRYGFVSRRRSFDPAPVAYIVKQAARRAGGRKVRDVSGHSFRAGHVSQAVRNGGPEYVVMKQTGHDLTIEQCFLVINLLPDPYRTMSTNALCTGMRVEEILALDWLKIDFERLCVKVEEAVVHGRVGPVKTDYSDDELPLDPDLAGVLLAWKRASGASESGLVFPSHVTGHCYHASPLQQDWIRRAGFCLVECPECGAAPGERCKGMKQSNRKRRSIQVHAFRRAAARAAGYGSVGWHTFRHKYTTLLRQFKTPLDVQQKLPRHADIRTTMGYGEVPMDNKRSANSQVVRAILLRKSTD